MSGRDTLTRPDSTRDKRPDPRNALQMFEAKFWCCYYYTGSLHPVLHSTRHTPMYHAFISLLSMGALAKK